MLVLSSLGTGTGPQSHFKVALVFTDTLSCVFKKNVKQEKQNMKSYAYVDHVR